MKVYIVTALYCEDTVICGIALDMATAKKIADHEEGLSFRPDDVYIEEFDTEDYAPLNAGFRLYEVKVYQDGEKVVQPASTSRLIDKRVLRYSEYGRNVSVYEVYAKDEEHAKLLASDFERTHKERKEVISATKYISESHQWKDR